MTPPSAKRGRGLRVGERDARGRMFVGHRVYWTNPTVGQECSTTIVDGDPHGWIDAQRWTLDERDTLRITRVYRPESKVRRALRGLVYRIDILVPNIIHPTTEYKNAFAALKAKP